MRWLLRVSLITTIITLLLESTVVAQTFPRYEENIYTGYVYDGIGYYENYYTNNVTSIYIIANTDNVFEAYKTEVYFWPLTSEYKVDRDKINRPLEGILEIYQHGKLVASLTPKEYSLVMDGDHLQPNKLVFGPDAESMYQAYQRASKEYYNVLLPRYNEENSLYEKAALDNLQRAFDGEPLLEIRPPLKPTAPSTIVSPPRTGFLVRLEEGHYHIQFRDREKNIIPGSEKKLEVFSPIRDGIGYEILPEKQWTKPVISHQPGASIYWNSDKVVYLKPFYVIEYPVAQYRLLKNPQLSYSNVKEFLWIKGDQIPDGEIEVIIDGQVIQRIPQKNFIVDSSSATSLGYLINELPDQGSLDHLDIQSPSFRAIKLELNKYPSGIKIRLVSEIGQVFPLSERQVIPFHTIGNTVIYTIPSIILVVGVLFYVLRRNLRR